MMNSKFYISALIVLLVIFTGTSCDSSEDTAKNETTSVKVETARAQSVQIQQEQSFSGTVRGVRRVDLSTKIMGRITQLEVEEGEFVEEGDLLVQIKDDQIKAQHDQVEAQLVEARANLENAETNYNRIKRLFEQSSATQKEYDDMKTRYQMAGAKVKTLEGKLREVKDMLDYTTLRAPIDGYVVRKTMEEGDMASPGQPLVTVENTGALEVKASVPESQINLLTRGDTVGIRVPAADRNSLEGRIVAINPSGNRGSRQFEVKVIFREPGTIKKVKPGMFAELSVARWTQPTVTVDARALIDRGQLTGLYTINDQQEAVLRWVRTGNQSGNHIEILSGISDGETYILTPDGRIHEGQKVEI